MKKTNITIALVALTAALALFAACRNNFYHELIPPDGDRITSFVVYGQTQPAAIGENRIELSVGKDVNIQTIYPSIAVSQGARVFPVTFEYVLATFPGIDIITEMKNFYTTDDLYEYTRNLIRTTPGFNVPVLDKPIDFSGPVKFFVIAGLGNTREYTVNVTQDTGEPTLLGFRFAKYDNAEILTDAVPVRYGDTLEATAVYPVEIPTLSYELIPSFQILGEKLEIDGVVITSGKTGVQFIKQLDVQQTKTIKVTRDGKEKEWALNLTFVEDQDTIRSITDFRFTVGDNALSIADKAVASIVNDGDFGTITITVLYEGAKPSRLVPQFISPGTVRVGEPGVVQSSGSSAQDFSAPLEYRVTSRDGQYTRVYTVRTEFVSVGARILSFGLSTVHNPGIIRGSRGEVADGHIIIDVHYGGHVAPSVLVPEFTAEGIVTVLGSVQTSGVSSQDFSRRQIYRVTNPKDARFSRDYSVQTRLIRDTSSDALITSFGFKPQQNLPEMVGRIQQDTISVHAPEKSGVSEMILSPYFTATGPVSVRGVAQESGVSTQIFSGAMEYTVVSPNGKKTRTYTVNVREMPALRVYVDSRAVGWNDGTSWRNAFRSIKDAADATMEYPAEMPKEMWIAAGTYTVGSGEYLSVVPNIVYSGGFSGWETNKDQRNTAANRTIISGGRSAENLFAGLTGKLVWDKWEEEFYPEQRAITGDVAFEHLEFTETERAISVTMAEGSDVRMTDLRFSETFSNLRPGSYYYAVWVSGANDVTVNNIELSNLAGAGIHFSGGSGHRDIRNVTANGVKNTAISVNNSSSLTMSEMNIQNSGGISASNVAGLVKISASRMENISGNGISITGGTGTRELSAITGNTINGQAINVSAPASSTVTIQSVTMKDIFLPKPNNQNISYNDYSKFNNTPAISIRGGIVKIEGSAVENVPSSGTFTVTTEERSINMIINHRGIVINADTVTVSDTKASEIGNIGIDIIGTTIRVDRNSSVTNTGGNGLSLNNTGAATVVENVTVTGAAGSSVRISGKSNNVTISGVHAKKGGGISVNSAGGVSIANSSVEDSSSGVSVDSNSWSAVAIAGVHVKNISASYGRGIHVRAGNTGIINSSVENAPEGISYYTYKYYEGARLSFTMANSTIKNTGQALEIRAGAFEVKGVNFINNLSSNYYARIASVSDAGMFVRCKFIHDSNMSRSKEVTYNPSFYEYHNLIETSNRGCTLIFDDCDFSNLLGSSYAYTYIFSRCLTRVRQSDDIKGIYSSPSNIQLTNSRFTFKGNENVGLYNGYAGRMIDTGIDPDYLNVKDVTILDHGSTVGGLFCFDDNLRQGTFRFEKNSENFYNGRRIYFNVDDLSSNDLAIFKKIFRLLDGASISFY
ncbi:MAG: right-handed parallel beta-helix repeat-containing protein [Treponema sp.]|nr:right-handed parallel beta-helix repeat-containing protein [Treponema sp.]